MKQMSRLLAACSAAFVLAQGAPAAAATLSCFTAACGYAGPPVVEYQQVFEPEVLGKDYWVGTGRSMLIQWIAFHEPDPYSDTRIATAGFNLYYTDKEAHGLSLDPSENRGELLPLVSTVKPYQLGFLYTPRRGNLLLELLFTPTDGLLALQNPDHQSALLIFRDGAVQSADPLYIRFITVPEPSTWAMMILGFGLTGGLLRRCRSEVGRTQAIGSS